MGSWEEQKTSKPRVAFSTKCWDNDWQTLLKDGFLKELIDRNDFNFDQKIIIINNVKDVDGVERSAKKNIEDGVIDNYYFITKYSDQVLKYFDIGRESFIEGNKDGYLYSICELFEIFSLQTDYLVHFSGDSILEKKYNWVERALKIFNFHENVAVVNPLWNGKYDQAKNESFLEKESYYLSKGFFSDQCYMIRLADFKNKIYNETHPFSDRYPRYAGNLFEKRVDAWMRVREKQRATLKEISYIHHNWTWYNKLIYKFIKS